MESSTINSSHETLNYLEEFKVVTKYLVAHEMVACKLLTCQCNFLCLQNTNTATK